MTEQPTGPTGRAYDDIPGTIVFDGRRGRIGYRLNTFCASLNDAANRAAFAADEPAYLDRFDLTADQRQAVLQREWLRLLELGGNIYYLYKLAACDGLTFQQLASLQAGVSEDEYVAMMIAGGRRPGARRAGGDDGDRRSGDG